MYWIFARRLCLDCTAADRYLWQFKITASQNTFQRVSSLCFWTKDHQGELWCYWSKCDVYNITSCTVMQYILDNNFFITLIRPWFFCVLLLFTETFRGIQWGGQFPPWSEFFSVLVWAKFHNWGAAMTQWQNHTPPTNMAGVPFPDPVSYVGWVCWFSTLVKIFWGSLRILKDLHKDLWTFLPRSLRILKDPWWSFDFLARILNLISWRDLSGSWKDLTRIFKRS